MKVATMIRCKLLRGVAFWRMRIFLVHLFHSRQMRWRRRRRRWQLFGESFPAPLAGLPKICWRSRSSPKGRPLGLTNRHSHQKEFPRQQWLSFN